MGVVINNPDDAWTKARTLQQPAIAFDTTKGSQQGRFFIIDFAQRHTFGPDMAVNASGEMTRQCFNIMRERGMLLRDLEDRLRVTPRCQAWPVITA